MLVNSDDYPYRHLNAFDKIAIGDLAIEGFREGNLVDINAEQLDIEVTEVTPSSILQRKYKMDLKPKPLKKEIFDKARELGITQIQLGFQGGGDEGWVHVSCTHPDDSWIDLEFEEEIETWVWQVYDYSGAGDGTDYGDDIKYDIENAVEENGTWKVPATSQDWSNQPEYGEEESFELGIQPQEKTNE